MGCVCVCVCAHCAHLQCKKHGAVVRWPGITHEKSMYSGRETTVGQVRDYCGQAWQRCSQLSQTQGALPGHELDRFDARL